MGSPPASVHLNDTVFTTTTKKISIFSAFNFTCCAKLTARSASRKTSVVSHFFLLCSPLTRSLISRIIPDLTLRTTLHSCLTPTKNASTFDPESLNAASSAPIQPLSSLFPALEHKAPKVSSCYFTFSSTRGSLSVFQTCFAASSSSISNLKFHSIFSSHPQSPRS